MPQDDEFGFWDDERGRSTTGRIPRLSRPSPSPVADMSYSGLSQPDDDFDHELWRSTDRPLTATRSTALTILRRDATRPPNFVLRRIAALVAVGIVAAPIAMIIGGGSNDEQRQVAGAESPVLEPAVEPGSAATADVAAPAPTVSVVAPVAAGETTTAVTQPVTSAVADNSATTAATAPAIGPAPDVESAPTAAPTVPDTVAPSVATRSVPADTAMATAGQSNDVVVETTVAVRPACSNEYEIVAGDYWILIADKVSVKLADVLDINGATVDTPLYAGRSVCLPAYASPPTTATPTTPAPTTTDAPTTTQAPTTTAAPTTIVKVTTTTTTTTAPVSTDAPSTTAAPPKNNYSKAEVEQIIRNVWPDDLEVEAIRIATRESNLIPTVRNYCCFGLFQLYWNVHKSWMASAGVTSSDQLFDPYINTYLAYAMYLRSGGWGPWAL